jgi:precorrin-3B synthase
VPPTAPAPVGPVAQRDGRIAIAVAVPLGRLSGPQAWALGAAARAGADEMYVTPWRTAVVPDIGGGEADRWLRELEGAGLVTDAASPWVGVSACAGRPGCAKALADVRVDAATALALPGAPPGDRATPVHWVGCERRCGRPAGRHVEVLATADGYEVRLDGQLRSAAADLARTAGAVTAARRRT